MSSRCPCRLVLLEGTWKEPKRTERSTCFRLGLKGELQGQPWQSWSLQKEEADHNKSVAWDVPYGGQRNSSRRASHPTTRSLMVPSGWGRLLNGFKQKHGSEVCLLCSPDRIRTAFGPLMASSTAFSMILVTHLFLWCFICCFPHPNISSMLSP